MTSGILPVEQGEEVAVKTAELLRQANPDELSCIVGATDLTGSAVLAIALWKQHQSAYDVFSASRVDETHQSQTWGIDDAAAEKESRLRNDLIDIANYLSLLQLPNG